MNMHVTMSHRPAHIGPRKVACLRGSGWRRRRRGGVDQRRRSPRPALAESASTRNPTGDHTYVAPALA